MEWLIIAGGMLGTIYMAVLMFCVMEALSFGNSIFDGLKMSLVVFFWVLVGVAWFIAMISPLFLALYTVGFFN